MSSGSGKQLITDELVHIPREEGLQVEVVRTSDQL